MKPINTMRTLTVLAIVAAAPAATAVSSQALNVATTDTAQAVNRTATPPHIVLACYSSGPCCGPHCRGR